MTKIKISDLPRFDVTEFMENDEAIAEFLNIAFEDGDAAFIDASINEVIRAMQQNDIARKTALPLDRTTHADSLLDVIRAYGFKLVPHAHA